MAKKLPKNKIAQELEAYIKRTGTSASTFGRKHFKDPNFVGDVLAGRSLMMKTAEKLQKLIRSA